MTPLPFEYPDWVIATENGLALKQDAPEKVKKAFATWLDIANRNEKLE